MYVRFESFPSDIFLNIFLLPQLSELISEGFCNIKYIAKENKWQICDSLELDIFYIKQNKRFLKKIKIVGALFVYHLSRTENPVLIH